MSSSQSEEQTVFLTREKIDTSNQNPNDIFSRVRKMVPPIICHFKVYHFSIRERFEIKSWQNDECLSMYIKQYHMESALYGIYALVVLVLEMERVRAANEGDF